MSPRLTRLVDAGRNSVVLYDARKSYAETHGSWTALRASIVLNRTCSAPAWSRYSLARLLHYSTLIRLFSSITIPTPHCAGGRASRVKTTSRYSSSSSSSSGGGGDVTILYSRIRHCAAVMVMPYFVQMLACRSSFNTYAAVFPGPRINRNWSPFSGEVTGQNMA